MSWLDDINAAMGRAQDLRQDNYQEASGGSSDARVFDRRFNGDFVYDELLRGFVERDS